MATIWTACLAASLACSGAGYSSPSQNPSPVSTPTDNPSPTVSPAPTAIPLPTCTASPTLIPGIEEPIAAGNAELLISRVLRRDAFRCGTDSEPIDDPENHFFLLLILTVGGGPKLTNAQLEKWIQDQGIDHWTVNFTGPDGAGESRGYAHHCFTRHPGTLVLIELDLAFPVSSKADSFFLILPDGPEIPLDFIMP
jgi:hypothetical protein